jgi:hypothetical protein
VWPSLQNAISPEMGRNTLIEIKHDQKKLLTIIISNCRNTQLSLPEFLLMLQLNTISEHVMGGFDNKVSNM